MCGLSAQALQAILRTGGATAGHSPVAARTTPKRPNPIVSASAEAPARARTRRTRCANSAAQSAAGTCGPNTRKTCACTCGPCRWMSSQQFAKIRDVASTTCAARSGPAYPGKASTANRLNGTSSVSASAACHASNRRTGMQGDTASARALAAKFVWHTSCKSMPECQPAQLSEAPMLCEAVALRI